MKHAATPDAPLVVRSTLRLEGESRLDPVVRAVSPVAEALIGPARLDRALRGSSWLGHAVHPTLTDLPLGMWTSASVLDLVGGPGARGPARRLVGLGIVCSLPTSVTGLAEFGATPGQRERRVGLVHAMANTAALGLYAASYRARRHDRQLAGALLSVAGAGLAVAGGYLGGHLTEARKVASRHPAFGS